MQVLIGQGATWEEAWEATREAHLFLPEEAPEIEPASEGLQTQRAVNQMLGNLEL